MVVTGSCMRTRSFQRCRALGINVVSTVCFIDLQFFSTIRDVALGIWSIITEVAPDEQYGRYPRNQLLLSCTSCKTTQVHCRNAVSNEALALPSQARCRTLTQRGLFSCFDKV